MAAVAVSVGLTSNLWAAVWRGELSRAWDGTGHSAIAQIYDQTIFPNTFGWKGSYFHSHVPFACLNRAINGLDLFLLSGESKDLNR